MNIPINPPIPGQTKFPITHPAPLPIAPPPTPAKFEAAEVLTLCYHYSVVILRDHQRWKERYVVSIVKIPRATNHVEGLYSDLQTVDTICWGTVTFTAVERAWVAVAEELPPEAIFPVTYCQPKFNPALFADSIATSDPVYLETISATFAAF